MKRIKELENMKEKGLFRKFLDWLKTPDEDEIDDNGDLNIRAFKDEDAELIMELKTSNKRIDSMGNRILMDRTEKREKAINDLKVTIPHSESKEEAKYDKNRKSNIKLTHNDKKEEDKGKETA